MQSLGSTFGSVESDHKTDNQNLRKSQMKGESQINDEDEKRKKEFFRLVYENEYE